MAKIEMKVAPPEAFFELVKRTMRLADRRKPVPRAHVIFFEEPQELLDLMSEKRLQLIKEIKNAPGPIADIARRVGRDRAAITRDVQKLSRFGVLTVEDRPLAGHGRQKWVKASASSIRLVAEF